jgi:arginine N-succinyltransferase
MVVMRPIRLDDLDAVIDLVKHTGFGLTTLPRDETVLRRRIEKSLNGFKAEPNVQPRTYLFAMEDTAARKLAGVCGIVSQVGGTEPFYTFCVETSIHESKQLGVRNQISTLHFTEYNDGPSEIGSLFLSPDYRKDGNGRLLSLCRFLFMADNLEYFNSTVIAEMRGVVDGNGRSAFWDAVGRHFFEVDFPTADHMSMVSKQFIADLMPRHPIYIPLLPYEAQRVLGQVHPDTQPALKMLQNEGFMDSGMRDLFEGGPTMQCPLKEIRGVRQSVKLALGEIGEVPKSSPMIIANARRDFRACKGTVEIRDGRARIESSVAEALDVKIGDSIRFVTAMAESRGEGNRS